MRGFDNHGCLPGVGSDRESLQMGPLHVDEGRCTGATKAVRDSEKPNSGEDDLEHELRRLKSGSAIHLENASERATNRQVKLRVRAVVVGRSAPDRAEGTDVGASALVHALSGFNRHVHHREQGSRGRWDSTAVVRGCVRGRAECMSECTQVGRAESSTNVELQ